jgi:hypothetical protein
MFRSRNNFTSTVLDMKLLMLISEPSTVGSCIKWSLWDHLVVSLSNHLCIPPNFFMLMKSPCSLRVPLILFVFSEVRVYQRKVRDYVFPEFVNKYFTYDFMFPSKLWWLISSNQACWYRDKGLLGSLAARISAWSPGILRPFVVFLSLFRQMPLWCPN